MRIIFGLLKAVVLIGFGFWLAIFLGEAKMPQLLDKERLESDVKAVGEQIKEYVPDLPRVSGSGDKDKVGNTDKLTDEDRRQLNDLINNTSK